jgi:ribonucleoside-diphosphate reductase alpha chain
MGVLDTPEEREVSRTMAGKPCPECGNATVIHKDGCDFCTACGYVGQCG